MHRCDSIVFNAALKNLQQRIDGQKSRTFTAIKILWSHAPFDRDIFKGYVRVAHAKTWFNKELRVDSPAEGTEYMGRLR